jgi:hypothetical protein
MVQRDFPRSLDRALQPSDRHLQLAVRDENGDALPTSVMASGGKYKVWEDFEHFNCTNATGRMKKNALEKELFQEGR